MRTLCALAVLACLAGSWLSAVPMRIHVPAGEASQTLRAFARQASVQLVYPVEDVRGVRTQAVRGHLEPWQALALMLASTGLEAVEDPATGAIVVRRVSAHPASSAGPAPAPPAPAGPAAAAEDVEIVLSPFEIRTRADTGYRPANSVSATRIAREISSLPMSVSAFTGEFIADQKPYDLYDVVKWTPGVHQDNQSPQGWARYAVRGFTSASIQRNGFGSFRFVDTSNIARVEVVKGPSSLLYGQINPGGVINYVTKRPEPEPAASASASVGSHGYTRMALDATGPVPGTDGALLLRGIAMMETIQEFQRGARGRKHLFAPSARWRVADGLTVVAEYERFARLEDMLTSGVPLVYENAVASRPYPGLPWDFNYAGTGDFQDFVSDALTLEVDARLADRVYLRGSYIDSRWDMEWRATGQGATGLISQSAIDAYYPADAGLTPRDAMFRRNRWEHQWGGERSLQVDLTGTFDLGGARVRPLVGAKRNLKTRQRNLQRNNATTPGSPLYLRPWDLRDPGTWDRSVPFGVDALVPVADGAASSDGTSWYGVVSVAAWEERLQALAGYAVHAVSNHPTSDRVAGTRFPASHRSAGVPQVGALHRVTRGLSVFGTYSESFLANATMLRVNNVPTTPATPSIGRGWEAGGKVELWEGRVSGTLSLYAIDAAPSGIVVVTSGVDGNGTTLFTDIQGGSQRSRGVEVELLVTPTRDLQVFAAFGTCDASYTRHPTNPALNGARLVAAPERTANLWFKYTVARTAHAQFVLSGGVNHVGETTYVANNPAARFGAYTTVDLGAGCTFRAGGRAWSVDLLVKNVADERYYVSASSWGFPRHAILSFGTRF